MDHLADSLRAELFKWGARLALRAAGHDAPGLKEDLWEASKVMLKAERSLGNLDVSAKALFATEVATGPQQPTPSEN